MYTKNDLLQHIANLGIKPEDTLLIHSSMKAIGEVENRADTVLDAFIAYMEPGLLIFPTHTWSKENNKDNIFNPLTEPSCVGILTNLFLKRTGVVRSWQLRASLEAVNSTIEVTDDKVTATWRQADNGQLFQVQLALDPEFTALELDQKTDQPEVSFDQLHGQVRYLRVRAIGADGYEGPWGSVQRIEPPLDQGIWAIPILFILGLLFI